MVALDGSVFDGAVHPHDIAVGPRLVRLGQSMLDAMLAADLVEARGPGKKWALAPSFRATEHLAGSDSVSMTFILM